MSLYPNTGMQAATTAAATTTVTIATTAHVVINYRKILIENMFNLISSSFPVYVSM